MRTQVQEQVPEKSVRSTDNGRSSSVAKTCSGGPTTPNSAPLGSDVKGSDERLVLKADEATASDDVSEISNVSPVSVAHEDAHVEKENSRKSTKETTQPMKEKKMKSTRMKRRMIKTMKMKE